jgi:secreted trypsin-like serine protease
LRVFPKLMVCAGAERLDTCVGDSGGPLFFRADALRGSRIGYRQIGITSFGLGCALAEFPGVYTEVNAPSIRSFIRSAARG